MALNLTNVLGRLFGVGLVIAPAMSYAEENFYALTARSISGQEISLAQYQGKVTLVVNTASKCGFTPQYKSLQALYEKYSPQGVMVLGFPSNDFLYQEPGADEDIKKFCEVNYGVTFPLMAKDRVKGKKKQEIYKFLTGSAVGQKEGEIGWNFVKFLIDKKGRVAARYGSKIDPLSDEITKKIEQLLQESPSMLPVKSPK